MRAVFLVLALTMLPACSDSGPDERRLIGCLLLKDFVGREFETTRGPLALSDDPASILPPEAYEDIDALVEVATGLEGNTRSRDELRRMFEEEEELSTLSPTTECPSLAALKREKAFVPPAGEEQPPTTEDGLLYTYSSVAVSLPLVDLKRGEATFQATRVCGPLCAGGVTVTYRRGEDGTWRYASESSTWIS